MTTLCLQWEPEPAAIAFLYLAAKVSKHDLQGSAKKSWWLKFVNNVDQHDLEDICGIVLDSYEEDEVEKESRFYCGVLECIAGRVGVLPCSVTNCSQPLDPL